MSCRIMLVEPSNFLQDGFDVLRVVSEPEELEGCRICQCCRATIEQRAEQGVYLDGRDDTVVSLAHVVTVEVEGATKWTEFVTACKRCAAEFVSVLGERVRRAA